jgi:HEAT repeat protein
MRILFCYGLLAVALGVAATARAADLPLLMKQMNDPDADVRRAAARALGQMGPDATPAVPLLTAAVEKDRDLYVRRFSAQALGQIGPNASSAIPALTSALKDEKKEMIEAAVTALGKMGPAAVPALADAFKGSSFSKTAKAKGNNQPRMESEQAFLRRRAAEALGRLGPEAKAAVPALISALNDPAARIDAALALGEIGPAARSAIPALTSIADEKKPKDKALKKAAADALRKIQTKE